MHVSRLYLLLYHEFSNRFVYASDLYVAGVLME
jgi:hypothetical protein